MLAEPRVGAEDQFGSWGVEAGAGEQQRIVVELAEAVGDHEPATVRGTASGDPAVGRVDPGQEPIGAW